MAQTHLNTALNSLGLDQAEIDSILAIKEDATDFDPNTVVGKLNTAAETRIKNDPKFWEALDETNANPVFVKKIEAQQYGRAAEITRTKALKGLGLTKEDLGEMTEEQQKNVELYLQKAGEVYASKKASDPQLQAELVKARKALEDKELEIPELEGKYKTQYEAKYNDNVVDLSILTVLAGVEGLTTPPKYLVKTISDTLKSQYAFAVTGLDAVPMQKDKPTLKVVEGSKELTLADLINKILVADKLIVEKNTGGKTAGKTTANVEPDGQGGLKISDHIQKQIDASK